MLYMYISKSVLAHLSSSLACHGTKTLPFQPGFHQGCILSRQSWGWTIPLIISRLVSTLGISRPHDHFSVVTFRFGSSFSNCMSVCVGGGGGGGGVMQTLCVGIYGNLAGSLQCDMSITLFYDDENTCNCSNHHKSKDRNSNSPYNSRGISSIRCSFMFLHWSFVVDNIHILCERNHYQ